jgi:tetratricopeptide (TPR) repeat protein
MNRHSGALDNSVEPSSPVLSPLVLCAILAFGTLLLYSLTTRNGFVNYDDPAYVTANAHVLRGICWESVRWALTTTFEANWHPLSWLSHMLDVQLFGTDPRGHHLVNVLVHAINVVLLFFVLRQATGNILRSAMVAALFAVHPLNVECVAWIAERKSLLSMLFLLLALGAYGGYARKRSVGRYLLVFVLFALGLAAKPMIVTLPVLLLLWDYWPLERIAVDGANFPHRPGLGWLISEKVPLLALSAGSSWITVYAQEHSGGALGSTALLPFAWRIENALYSYLAYVEKGLWPSGLAVFYPHPEGTLSLWKVTAAAIFLLATSFLTWRYRRNHKYLWVGWLWFLISMAPMIGIVQVGRQAMADRYAYLPFVGLFVMMVWGCGDLFAVLNLSKLVVRGVAAAVLIAFASATFLQVSYWRDSYTLFSHAIAVTARNGVAEDNLGTALMQMGRPDLAMQHFEAAVEFTPQLSTAHYNLGVLQQQRNRPDAAYREYELALKYSADPVEIVRIHGNLGFLLMGLNNLSAAKNEFNAALQIDPEKQNCVLGRGIVEFHQKDLDDAVSDLSHAARLAPLAQADFWLGRALEAKGQTQAAGAAYQSALRLAPDLSEAQQRLDALRQVKQ